MVTIEGQFQGGLDRPDPFVHLESPVIGTEISNEHGNFFLGTFGCVSCFCRGSGDGCHHFGCNVKQLTLWFMGVRSTIDGTGARGVGIGSRLIIVIRSDFRRRRCRWWWSFSTAWIDVVMVRTPVSTTMILLLC